MKSGKLLHKGVGIRLRENVVPLDCIRKCLFGYSASFKGNAFASKDVGKKFTVFKDFGVAFQVLNIRKFISVGFAKMLIFQHLRTVISQKTAAFRLDHINKGSRRLGLIVQIIRQFEAMRMRIQNDILLLQATSENGIGHGSVVCISFLVKNSDKHLLFRLLFKGSVSNTT